jgi:hypothetical protein
MEGLSDLSFVGKAIVPTPDNIFHLERTFLPRLLAKCIDQQFFLFFGEAIQRIERRNVGAKSDHRQAYEGGGGEPWIAEPSSREQHGCGDSTNQDLHTERRPNRHAIVSLALKFSNFHFFGEAQRRPIGNR